MRLFLFDTLLSAAIFPFILRTLADLRGWVRVGRAPPPPAADAPLVTVLVPARDEERSIEACIVSLLAQDYPRDRLRTVAMDDRSTDATPAILARLASADDRLTVLQGSPLPKGWLGKCWALHQAAAHADPASTYFIFVDADTRHSPSMVSSVVAFAERERVDLLSLAPHQVMQSQAERMLLPTIFGITMGQGGTLAEVNDPARREVAKAIGHFILFRASVYRAIGGHESVRDEIVEDFALARRTKGTGHRVLLADGRDLVQTRMYHSAAEIWDGFSKNAYNESQKRTGGALGGLLGLPIIALGPWLIALAAIARLRGPGPPRRLDAVLLVQSLVQVAAVVQLARVPARMMGLPGLYGLAQPIAGMFLWGILANSTWRTRTGRGVRWKGRTY